MGIKISDHFNVDDIEFTEEEIYKGYLALEGKTSVNIFLDDIRLAPGHYDYVCKTAEELLALIKAVPSLSIGTLSLDHDLGEGVKDGYDFVKAFSTMDVPVNRIQFHTDNMIGFKNMYMYLANAQQHGLISEQTTIDCRKISVVDKKETAHFSPVL